jgi:hypothetical protein
MTQSNYVNSSTIQQWLVDNIDIDRINEILVNQGHDCNSIDEHIKAFNKAKIQQRQMKGLIYMGIGACIGFLGCVMALINPSHEIYYVSLYGLTTIAVTVAFIGLYYLLE